MIEAVVGLLCLTAFAVRWYQVSLFTGPRAAPTGLFPGAWLRFLLYTLLLYLIAGLLIVAMLLVDRDGIPDYVGLLDRRRDDGGVARAGALHAALPCGRFRQAAIDRRGMAPPGGNTWRLFVTVLLVTIPVVFVTAMIVSAFFAGFHIEAFGDKVPPLGFFLLRSVLSTCGNVLVVALCASVIAGFYRRLEDTPVQAGSALRHRARHRIGRGARRRIDRSTAEDTIEQVAQTRSRRPGSRIGRRRRTGAVADQRRGALARQRLDRHAARRDGHEIVPGMRRYRAAGDFLHRRIIVIAEPHAANQIGGVADEERIARILGRAGLACRRAIELRGLARPVSDNPGQKLVHDRRPFAGSMTRPRP